MKRSLLSLALLAAAVANGQESLTIERAVELAVTRNERAAAAQTDVEAAEARVRQARSFFFPRVDVTGSYRNDTSTDTRNTLSTSALLTQTLFSARAFPLYRVARLQRDAVRLDASEETRVLAFDAANAFLLTLGYEQVLLAAEHRRDFARTSLDDARARFEAGLVSSNDVTRAELELATAVREVAQADGNRQTARVALGTLLNADVTQPLAEPQRLLEAATQPPSIGAAEVTAAQQERRDIAAARLRVEGLREFAREPRMRFIPSATLTAQTRNINEGPVSERTNDGFVGVTLNWPLFDAGIRRAEEAERTALARGAELDLSLAVRDVERQLRSAAARLTSEQAALREAAAAVRAARKNAGETNELYRQGLASALELADANQRLFEAEVAEVNARYRMAEAYLAVREARGEAVVGAE